MFPSGGGGMTGPDGGWAAEVGTMFIDSQQ